MNNNTDNRAYRDRTLRAIPAFSAVVIVLFAIVGRGALLDALGNVPFGEFADIQLNVLVPFNG